MPGDNFSVRVLSEGREHFEAALKLAWSNSPGGKATHYMSPIPDHICLECYGKKERSVWMKDKEYISVPCRACKDGSTPSRAGIVLLWSASNVYQKPAIPLPYPMQLEAATEFLWHWLQSSDFGRQPDHDGDNGKGFEVTTGNGWGHVEECHYSIVGVYPDWQMYGK
jgi:hypothetical protein